MPSRQPSLSESGAKSLPAPARGPSGAGNELAGAIGPGRRAQPGARDLGCRADGLDRAPPPGSATAALASPAHSLPGYAGSERAGAGLAHPRAGGHDAKHAIKRSHKFDQRSPGSNGRRRHRSVRAAGAAAQWQRRSRLDLDAGGRRAGSRARSWLLGNGARPLALCTGVPVFETSALGAPAAIGIWRPALMLPSAWHGWDAEQMAAVLAHEASHLQRNDLLTLRLAELHRTIFWFSPLGWWLPRKLSGVMEAASDEA